MLATSNAFAGGGGESSGELPDPTFLFIFAGIGLLCWILKRIVGGCLDYRRRARIVRAIYSQPLPDPYRDPANT